MSQDDLRDKDKLPNDQKIDNAVPNQGAQGIFQGPVNINHYGGKPPEDEELCTAARQAQQGDEIESTLIGVLRHSSDFASEIPTTNKIRLINDIAADLFHATEFAYKIARSSINASANAKTRATIRAIANDLKLANECIRTLNISSGNTILLDLNRAQELFELIQKIAEQVLSADHPEVVAFKEAIEEFNRKVQEQQRSNA